MSGPAPEDAPLISVALPCWNAARFLRPVLDRLDRQSWPRIEFLLGDDASDDATPDLLAAFADGRPRTHLVLRRERLGWVANTNDLLARATGDFVCYAPHDDLLRPRTLERLAQALIAAPDAALAHGPFLRQDADGTRRRVDWIPPHESASTAERLAALATRPHGWWGAVHGLIRAEALRAAGGMRLNAAGEVGADFTWMLRLIAQGRFVHIPDITHVKRIRPESLFRSWTRSLATLEAVDRDARAALVEAGLPPAQVDEIAQRMAPRREAIAAASGAEAGAPAP